MAPPRVSVVVPTHNRAALLEKTAASILAQTERALELVVVDDGSTDETPALLERLRRADARVRALRLPGSGRPSLPRNFGAKGARGEFIAFCDSDDTWYPEKLEVQLALFDARPELALVSARCRFVSPGGEPGEAWPPSIPEPPSYAALAASNFLPCSMTVVRRRALDEAKGFDEAEDLAAAEDWDLWLRIARRHPFACSPEVLGDYLVHPGGISRAQIREHAAVVAVYRRLEARDRPTFAASRRRAAAAARELTRLLARARRPGPALSAALHAARWSAPF